MTFPERPPRAGRTARRAVLVAVVGLAAGLLVTVPGATPALADVANGALIYQAGNNDRRTHRDR